jgi:hypothetical protein
MLIPADTSNPAHARNPLNLRRISFLRIVNQQMLLWTNARTPVSPAIATDGASAGSQGCSNAGEGSGPGHRGEIHQGRPIRRRDGKGSGPQNLTDEQKTIYAIGLSMAQSLSSLDLTRGD